MPKHLLWILLIVLLFAVGCTPSPEPVGVTNPSHILTMDQVKTEIAEKKARLLDFMKEERLIGMVLQRPENYAWITAGYDNNMIEFDKESGAVAVFLTERGKEYLLASKSEGPRVHDRLNELGFESRHTAWYQQQTADDARMKMMRGLLHGQPGRIGADSDFPGTANVFNDFQPLRYELTSTEIEKLRWLGRETALAVEEVCRILEPGMSGYDMESLTARALWRRGIRPTVLLTGSDEQLFRYRHVPPSDDTIDSYAMVNVCAEKWGLTVAVTRFVHFGPLPDSLQTRLSAAVEVSARYHHATRPGKDLGELFEEMKQWYVDEGFPEEWREHHQGGAIGYDNREFVIYPFLQASVRPNQAFAWNPTVQGAKVEDTIIAHADSTQENVTRTGQWPEIRVDVDGEVYPQPGILLR
ncbi:M24 family metallopeptidase [bacterium]|nr:M24 family metallopeptidase [bacterium]